MRTEERIARALREQAQDRDVDLQALYAATRARAAAATSGSVRARRRRWTAPVLVAAALLAVVAAGVGARDLLLDAGPDLGPSGSTQGDVDTEFACPARRTIDYGPGSIDDSFLPGLDRAGRPAGEATAAPRWQVEERGDTAVLRLGNADGTLASRVTFRRVDGGYERVRATVCSNTAPDGGSVRASDRLGDHPGLGSATGQLTAADFPAGSVRVDDRLSYDTVGLVTRRSIWAEPCDDGVCLTAGAKDVTITTGPVRPNPLRPEDRTSQLANPDDVVGQEPPYRLYAVYDPDGEVARVSWERKGGEITRVEPVAGGGWPGNLFLALVPADDFAALTVHPRDGEVRTYTAGQIR